MRIGAYQFPVCGVIESNYKAIREAVSYAAHEGVKVLFFPECALTGYPPHDIPDSASVDYRQVEHQYSRLQELSDELRVHLIVGTIERSSNGYTNSALLFSPNRELQRYTKRALGGWDQDNFTREEHSGVFEIDGYRIGVRICFEIRFPEYFRELYKQKTNLNAILFYDISKTEDLDRYDLIRAHIRTRAVENVAHTLAVNTCSDYQTAPTGLYDRSGAVVCELERGREGLLVFELEKTGMSFGETGRKEISDELMGMMKE